MNRASTIQWKTHFFPLGMAFLMVGAAGLLQAVDLVSSLPFWRYALLAVVSILFFVVQSTGIGQAPEAVWIWLVLIWVFAGILRIGGLGLFQLYPLLVALLGCSLLLRYAKSRGPGGMSTGATNE
jgi:hypothetical protein